MHRYVGRKKAILVLKINFLSVIKVEDTNIKAKPKKKGDSLTQMMMKAQLRKTDDEDDEKEKARIYRKTGYRTTILFFNFPLFNLSKQRKERWRKKQSENSKFIIFLKTFQPVRLK